MPFFSVIIPVYQAEKYIKRSVESVLAQRFSDWELILADDGSKDHSPELCDDFAKKDSRIQVLHKENGGAASARNQGVEAALGDYILFLDSDDYWEGEDFMDILKANLQKHKSDICLYGCMDEFADTHQRVQSRGNYHLELFQKGSKGDILMSLIRTNEFPGSCWIMAAGREFLKKNKITFLEGNRAEDIDWILQVLSKAENLSCIKEPYYIYSKNRNDSVTGTAGIKSIESILDTVQSWSVRLRKENDRKVYTALNSYLIFELLTAVILYGGLTGEEKAKVDSRFRKINIDYSAMAGKKIIIVGFIYRLFGVKKTSKILKLLRK